MAGQGPTALIPGLSIQRNLGGEEAMRMAMVLQAATGNIGKMGGASGGCIWDGYPFRNVVGWIRQTGRKIR